MTKLTRAQKAALTRADTKGGPVVVLARAAARNLIRDGYLQKVNMSPEPTNGIAVALTTKGKSWLAHARSIATAQNTA